MPDPRIKGRPLTDLLDTASELEKLEQQKREIDARLGEQLRSARLDAGLSMGDLASSIGATKSYVSQVENGVRGASSKTLLKFYGSITAASGDSWSMDVNNTNQEVESGNKVNSPQKPVKKKGRRKA